MSRDRMVSETAPPSRMPCSVWSSRGLGFHTPVRLGNKSLPRSGRAEVFIRWREPPGLLQSREEPFRRPPLFEEPRVKRILFVSRQFPPDFVRSVHGVYIRMRVFLDALQEMADSLEMLFYVEEGVDASPAAMQQAEADLRAFWGIRARVTLCPVAVADNPRGFVNHYLRPAASFFAQSLYAGTAGPPQVAAFETALDASPEAIFVHRLDSMCPALLTRRPLPPIYLDLDDIEHVKVLRELR